jgi:hypothetical protein
MRKYSLITMFVLLILLSSCKSDETSYNYRPRQNDSYISIDGKVLIDYKTDKNGELERLTFDRLLTIEEMITKNPNIDFNIEVEGFSGEIFTGVPAACLLPSGVQVPINIEVGSVRYKFRSSECLYKEVGRDNEFKTTSFAKEYGIKDTILEPVDTKVSIVIFIDGSTQLFTEIYYLPHTLRTIGVYGIKLSIDSGRPLENYLDYTKNMKIYEQFLLSYQDNERALDEIYGVPSEINLLNLDQLDKITVLIEDFVEVYEEEVTAFKELVEEIGIREIKSTEDETPTDEIPNEETTETRRWLYGY